MLLVLGAGGLRDGASPGRGDQARSQPRTSSGIGDQDPEQAAHQPQGHCRFPTPAQCQHLPMGSLSQDKEPQVPRDETCG